MYRCDYQSERHCSKTVIHVCTDWRLCDYQSERHCSKTYLLGLDDNPQCDYQSERHCSKTAGSVTKYAYGAITSQNDTAPKLKKRIRVVSPVRLPVRTTLLQNMRDWQNTS